MLNNIYLICGKSGSGKTTVVEKLEQNYGYAVLKSYTTRKQRHPNDTDHIYSDISDYMAAKENNTIVTSTVFDRNYYWATREQLDDCDLYVIDKDGIESLQEKYDGSRQLVVIYIDVDPEECIKRMKKRGDKDAVMRYPIPVPSLKEQERIVDILDRFDTLCNDISAGLPAEIEARQKQYEYYRDKLLNFKEMSV